MTAPVQGAAGGTTSTALDREVEVAIRRFVAWLDGFGPLSQDHLDLYMAGPGRRAKALYHRRRRLGTAAVLPFVLVDAFAPRLRRLVRRPRRFPIADAHYALGFLTRWSLTGAPEDERRARAFLAALEASRCPGEADYCWGYPFDWETVIGTWPRGRPLITQTPYGFEAFDLGAQLLGDARFGEVAESVARFAEQRIPSEEVSPGVVVSAYTPDDRRRVVNAVAYRAMILTRAGRLFARDAWVEQGLANARWVVQAQAPDGSWPYAHDGHDDFVDNFHTCFNLKNLYKVWRQTGEDELVDSIRRGYRFYKDHLLDPSGRPLPFHRTRRRTPFRRQLYDYAEGLNLALLLRSVDPDAAGIADALTSQVLDEWVLSDGHFVTEQLLRGRNTVPYHRWAQAQMFHALVRRLEPAAAGVAG